MDLNKPTKKYIKTLDVDFLDDEYKSRYIYWRGFYDIGFFTNYFFSHYKQDKKTGVRIADAKVHKELRKNLLSNDDILVVFPRDFAKSTNSFFVVMHQLLYKTEKHIGLIMSEGLGVETIGKIRDEFETNEKIKYIFGRLVPNRTAKESNKKRTNKQLDLLNGTKIESLTLKGSIRGRRFTKIIVDDPQENKDVRSITISDQFVHWFFSSVYPILDPTGNCVVIGTNVGELSFVNFLLKEGRGFVPIEYKAIINPEYKVLEDGKKHIVGGKSIWDKKWSIKDLDKRMQTVGRNIFQQEYMNDPMTLTGSLVFDADIVSGLVKQEFTYDDRIRNLRVYQPPCDCCRGLDLSMGGNNGDYSTIVARDDEFNLVFSFQGRVLRYELIDVIDHLEGLGYTGTKVFERNFGTAQAIFDVVKLKPRYNDIYRAKTIGTVNEKETLNLGRFTSRSNKEKMIADLQYLLLGYDDTYGLFHQITQFDNRQVAEMKYYVFDDNGGMNAMPGHHDDLIIADALCVQAIKDKYGY